MTLVEEDGYWSTPRVAGGFHTPGKVRSLPGGHVASARGTRHPGLSRTPQGNSQQATHASLFPLHRATPKGKGRVCPALAFLPGGLNRSSQHLGGSPKSRDSKG